MPQQKALADMARLLLAEQASYREVMEREAPISVLHDVQQRLLEALQKVGASGDLDTILLAEKLILQNERERYAGTRSMESSLDNALNETDAALLLVDRISDPEAYKSVTDVYFHSHKLRTRGLPDDGARLFFRAHHSRLTDLEKSRLTGLDKALIGARKKNLAVAGAGYIELQNIALAGPAPAPATANSPSPSR